MLSDLHIFFKIPIVANLYQGLTTKALITTRCSGHFSAIKTIKSSSTQMVVAWQMSLHQGPLN